MYRPGQLSDSGRAEFAPRHEMTLRGVLGSATCHDRADRLAIFDGAWLSRLVTFEPRLGKRA